MRTVRVECLNERGQQTVIDASGWYARILQHEIDHLQGALYIDRMHTRTFYFDGELDAVLEGQAGERNQIRAA